MDCNPNQSYSRAPSKISYSQLLNYVGGAVTAANVAAAIVAYTGVPVAKVVEAVTSILGYWLDGKQKENETYLNNHGILFYYEGYCRYNHRAQRYIVTYNVVDVSQY